MSEPESQIEKTEEAPSAPSLLDQKQALGILPTWWFWRDKENVRLVKWPLRISIVAAFVLAIAVHAGWLVSGLIPVASITLALGLIERFVRRQALKRRSEFERHALTTGGGGNTDE